MYILNGKRLNLHQPFVGPDGTKYPDLFAIEWRTALGVTEDPDPVYPDPSTHSYVENADGSLVVTAHSAATLATMLAASNASFNAPIIAKLEKADLKIIRALADGDAARIATHRTAQAELRAQLK